jgi:hypothetical protein
MPFREENGVLVLRCINEHAPRPIDVVPGGHAHTTMRRLDGLWGLPEARDVPQANLRAMPLRAFRCAVCGYVETYHALVVDGPNDDPRNPW